jgi:hypothetical protein
MIDHFVNDDAAYLRWVHSHQHGYIVNLDKARTYPQYPMVHRASHKLISSPERTNYTTNEFIKVCSTDLAALERWSKEECGRVLNRCATCM